MFVQEDIGSDIKELQNHLGDIQPSFPQQSLYLCQAAVPDVEEEPGLPVQGLPAGTGPAPSHRHQDQGKREHGGDLQEYGQAGDGGHFHEHVRSIWRTPSG